MIGTFIAESLCSQWATLGRKVFVSSARIAPAIAMLLLGTTAHAGIIVGSSNAANGGNDPESEVINVVDDYNTANDPDLFADENLIRAFQRRTTTGIVRIRHEQRLHVFRQQRRHWPDCERRRTDRSGVGLFQVHGPGKHSVLLGQGSNADGFTLYTFMQGLNVLDTVTGTSGISHVSFWTGPPGFDPFGNPIPEPATALLAGLALAGFGLWHRRRSAA